MCPQVPNLHSFKYIQGWWLKHFPQQLLLDNTFGEKICPNNQSKNSLLPAQLKTWGCCFSSLTNSSALEASLTLQDKILPQRPRQSKMTSIQKIYLEIHTTNPANYCSYLAFTNKRQKPPWYRAQYRLYSTHH